MSTVNKRYSRQVLFSPIGEAGQKQFRRSRVALIGCGGLGTVAADMLVRAGVGFLRLVDRDVVEETNLQRQLLFDMQDVADNMPKAAAAERRLRAINPEVDLEGVVRDVDATSIKGLVEDVDIILDGTDNFETRYLINDAAIALDKPWVYGAAVSSHGMIALIQPGKTFCLRCLYEDPPAPGATPTCDNAGVLASIIHMVASVQTTEAMKWLCGAPEALSGRLWVGDVWENTHRWVSAQRRTDCQACAKREWSYLNAERGTFVTTMCGRNAVQLSWKEAHDVDLDALAMSLAKSGTVTVNKFMLKFENDEVTLSLFPDGRAIMEGVTDRDRARELYAKFVG